MNTLAGSYDYWIGGYPTGNTWVWSDFSELDYFDDYNLNTGGGYCLYQDSSYQGSGWSTDYCTSTHQHYYICKKQ